MRELVLKKGLRRTKVMMYDDIEELPVERFNKVNKYWMLSDHLGNSFEDIDKVHITKLYYVADNRDKVIKEIGNLRALIHNIIREVHPAQLAFAALVYSIDGKVQSDMTEEGLKRLVQELSDKGLSAGEVKKKTTREKIQGDLEECFKERFYSGTTLAFWSEIKRRTLKELDALIKGEQVDLTESDKQLGTFISPKNFIGSNSYELEYDRAFEQNCILLSSYTNVDVKKLNTKEYFALLDHHATVVKEREKRHGRKPY